MFTLDRKRRPEGRQRLPCVSYPDELAAVLEENDLLGRVEGY